MTEKKINSTLCYIEKNGCYLMLYRNKKKNDPCEGKWVGIGGKFEAGENPQQCLLREVREETGLVLTDHTFCGIIHFVSDTWPDEDMYLFRGTAYSGNDDFPVLYQEDDPGSFAAGSEKCFECNEGDLYWIDKNRLLGLNLWEGDKYFLEPLIAGENNIYMTCRYVGHKCVEVIK